MVTKGQVEFEYLSVGHRLDDEGIYSSKGEVQACADGSKTFSESLKIVPRTRLAHYRVERYNGATKQSIRPKQRERSS
jgi:hypothetical protein